MTTVVALPLITLQIVLLHGEYLTLQEFATFTKYVTRFLLQQAQMMRKNLILI